MAMLFHRGSPAGPASGVGAMPPAPEARPGGFRGNPYLFLGRRPFREARLRAYIVRQHRAGRPLAEILDDPYLRRLGSESFCWQVIQDPRTIAELERDVREAISSFAPRPR
jgi:hypothetical protein